MNNKDRPYFYGACLEKFCTHPEWIDVSSMGDRGNTRKVCAQCGKTVTTTENGVVVLSEEKFKALFSDKKLPYAKLERNEPYHFCPAEVGTKFWRPEEQPEEDSWDSEDTGE